MKKSKKRIILLLLLVLLLILMVLIGRGSYSKYITQVEGKGVMDVAKWAFLVNGKTASTTNLNLAQNYKNTTLKENHMAPGTKGFFTIVVDATGSEVGMDYHVAFLNEKNKPQNLQFQYEGHVVSNIKDLEPFLTGVIEQNSNEKIKTMEVEWNWPYETGKTEEEKKANNAKDTQDAKTIEQYAFDICITAEQVAPEI